MESREDKVDRTIPWVYNTYNRLPYVYRCVYGVYRCVYGVYRCIWCVWCVQCTVYVLHVVSDTGAVIYRNRHCYRKLGMHV